MAAVPKFTCLRWRNPITRVAEGYKNTPNKKFVRRYKRDPLIPDSVDYLNVSALRIILSASFVL